MVIKMEQTVYDSFLTGRTDVSKCPQSITNPVVVPVVSSASKCEFVNETDGVYDKARERKQKHINTTSVLHAKAQDNS